jgi:hypothetical protein
VPLVGQLQANKKLSFKGIFTCKCIWGKAYGNYSSFLNSSGDKLASEAIAPMVKAFMGLYEDFLFKDMKDGVLILFGIKPVTDGVFYILKSFIVCFPLGMASLERGTTQLLPESASQRARGQKRDRRKY